MSNHPFWKEKRIDKYDGQTIWVSKKPKYEIGNYLKLNTSSTVIDGNLTANSNNISMIQ